jgi:hypothetical protein
MPIKYQVKNWSETYENNKSRERDECSFVCVPNKHDGLGLTRILSMPNGAFTYGIFNLIIGACSRQSKPRDGWLTDDGTETGRPWTADDMAMLWRQPVAEIEKALQVLCSDAVGWMVAVSAREVPAECPPSAPEEKRIEEKRKEDRALPGPLIEAKPDKGKPVQALPELPLSLQTVAMKSAWADWLEHRRQKRKPVTRLAAERNHEEFMAWGEKRAIAAINHSIKHDYQGIYEPGKNGPAPPSPSAGSITSKKVFA